MAFLDAFEKNLLDKIEPFYCHKTDRFSFHQNLQHIISKLATDFGALSQVEYLVKDIRNNSSNGYIDIVWQRKLGVFAVFEIDSSLRAKSIAKLLVINANFRIWVYYGSKDPFKFARKHDPQNKIFIIKIRKPNLIRCQTVRRSQIFNIDK